MFGSIKKIFIGFLTGLVNGSSHTKCISLSNQKCMVVPTLINLHPNDYSQEFHYYSFAVKLDRCVGSCNSLKDLSNKVCFPNKTEDLNLSVFNIIIFRCLVNGGGGHLLIFRFFSDSPRSLFGFPLLPSPPFINFQEMLKYKIFFL